MRLPRLLVSAAASSGGKTTASLLLAAWARRRGLDLRPFKAGPDFIDPQYLAAVSGASAPSLDPWFLGPAALRRHFLGWAAGGDLALVEGVMGLYDGKRGAPFGRYSSAELARHLGLPVLLVLDARRAGPSLATQALGLMKADARLRFAGVLLNRCGPKGAALIAPALRRLTGLPCFGHIPELKGLSLPERHLGLTAPAELEAWQTRLEAALPEVERSVDFGALLRAARGAAEIAAPASPRRARRGRPFRLALALDEAFHFYYPENLALLQSLGAELACFSPLRDPALPRGCQGLWLGGGFPESFGPRLAANAALRAQVRRLLRGGLPVWAECGGLMWLARSLRGLDGKRHPMVGALPARVAMTGSLQHFGYTEARLAAAPWRGATRGLRLRGHEFHHSRLEPLGRLRSALQLRQGGRPARREGWRLPGGLATYFHAYLPSAPRAAEAFAAACRRARPLS